MAFSRSAPQASYRDLLAEGDAIVEPRLAVAQLRDGRDVKAATIQLLSAARGSDSQAREVVDSAALPRLVGVLRDGPDDAKRVAASTLWSIAGKSDELAQAVVSSDALPQLCRILHDGPEECKQSAASCLWNVAFHTKSLAHAVADVGAIAPLVAMVREGQPDLLPAATGTLYNMAAQSEALAQAVVDAHGVAPLAGVLERGPDEAKVNAAGICAYVAECTAYSGKTLRDSGVIPGLVAVLRYGPDVDDAMQSAAAALMHVCKQGGAYAQVVIDAGAEEVLRTIAANVGGKFDIEAAQASKAAMGLLRPVQDAAKRRASLAADELHRHRRAKDAELDAECGSLPGAMNAQNRECATLAKDRAGWRGGAGKGMSSLCGSFAAVVDVIGALDRLRVVESLDEAGDPVEVDKDARPDASWMPPAGPDSTVVWSTLEARRARVLNRDASTVNSYQQRIAARSAAVEQQARAQIAESGTLAAGSGAVAGSGTADGGTSTPQLDGKVLCDILADDEVQHLVERRTEEVRTFLRHVDDTMAQARCRERSLGLHAARLHRVVKEVVNAVGDSVVRAASERVGRGEHHHHRHRPRLALPLAEDPDVVAFRVAQRQFGAAIKASLPDVDVTGAPVPAPPVVDPSVTAGSAAVAAALAATASSGADAPDAQPVVLAMPVPAAVASVAAAKHTREAASRFAASVSRLREASNQLAAAAVCVTRLATDTTGLSTTGFGVTGVIAEATHAVAVAQLPKLVDTVRRDAASVASAAAAESRALHDTADVLDEMVIALTVKAMAADTAARERIAAEQDSCDSMIAWCEDRRSWLKGIVSEEQLNKRRQLSELLASVEVTAFEADCDVHVATTALRMEEAKLAVGKSTAADVAKMKAQYSAAVEKREEPTTTRDKLRASVREIASHSHGAGEGLRTEIIFPEVLLGDERPRLELTPSAPTAPSAAKGVGESSGLRAHKQDGSLPEVRPNGAAKPKRGSPGKSYLPIHVSRVGIGGGGQHDDVGPGVAGGGASSSDYDPPARGPKRSPVRRGGGR